MMALSLITNESFGIFCVVLVAALLCQVNAQASWEGLIGRKREQFLSVSVINNSGATDL